MIVLIIDLGADLISFNFPNIIYDVCNNFKTSVITRLDVIWTCWSLDLSCLCWQKCCAVVTM